MSRIRLAAIGLLILLSGFFWMTAASGAPAADPWPRWQAHDAGSLTVIDHSDWDRILQRYLVTNHPSGINRFQYGKVTKEDRQALETYLRMLQGVEVSRLNRTEQKAFWINLYNALTVDTILTHYPVKSIREIDISPGFFSNGPWDAELITIEGLELTLNDIEHRILRPLWRDNRLHYAVNCASLGCPNLQPIAYTAENLETMLEQAARDYVNHPRGVTFFGDRTVVSSIYFWFKEDFGGSVEGIVNHLKKYLTSDKQAQLEGRPKKLKHDYDWNLNI